MDRPRDRRQLSVSFVAYDADVAGWTEQLGDQAMMG